MGEVPSPFPLRGLRRTAEHPHVTMLTKTNQGINIPVTRLYALRIYQTSVWRLALVHGNFTVELPKIIDL
jgi:hypothetical protein